MMRVAGVAAALVALLAAAPAPADAIALIGSPSAADPFAPLVAAISLVAWALAAWLLLTALVTAAGRAPGVVGAAARALARRIAPRAVRHALEVLLGLTVAASALGATPASAADSRPQGARPAAAPALDWPTAAAPALDWPVPDSPATSPPAAPRPAVVTAPRQAAAVTQAPAAPAAPAAPDAVVVRPGDSLWAIAAAHLPSASTPAAVARSWPRWWSANRAVVGSDPDLIHPGTHLVPPPDPSHR